ncbi:MAG: anhydro-N-acetylmuramic acid kinase [Rhodobacteraceae bacterium]|nr:anhydro-N-acetylmuramic acid kinase [Paracoccaceae bacterium]
MLKGGPIAVLGAMSGTSLDGVDAAVLMTDGVAIFGFGPTGYRAYSKKERRSLRAALGQWQGAKVRRAEKAVMRAHTLLLSEFQDIDMVGFHGQTLAHDPAGRGTLQIGDGAALAEALALPVVWDFRSADVKMGGEGAPLAPFYHHALARYLGLKKPVAFLNLGGVGNLTWVDPIRALPEAEGALLAFDTGPANAPLNDLMRMRRKKDYDEGGALAARGTVDDSIISAFAAHQYFTRMPPKSLDRDDFSALLTSVSALSDADAAATLTACAAVAVMRGVEHCPRPPSQIIVCGGGRHNKVMMQMTAAGLDCPVVPAEEHGLDGDMIEAQAFAFLAARVAAGLPTSCPSTTGVAAAIGGANISRPLG